MMPYSYISSYFKINYDYIPILSSIESTSILLKYTLNFIQAKPLNKFKLTSLKNGTLLRHVVLLLPVIGNILIAIYDFKTSSEYSFTLSSIQVDGLSLKYASLENKKKPIVVSQALRQNIRAFQHADNALRNCSTYIKEHLFLGLSLFHFASDEQRSNETLILELMMEHGCSILKYVMPDLLDNESFMEKAMEIFPEAFKFSKKLRLNEEFVLTRSQKNPHYFKFSGLKKNRKFVQKLMRSDISFLNDADLSIKSDPWFVKEEMKLNPKVLLHTPLKKDESFLSECIHEDLSILLYAPDSYRRCKVFLRQFYLRNFEIIQYAEDSIREDFIFNVQLIDECQLSLGSASEKLKKSEEFVLEYVKIGLLSELKAADASLLQSFEFAKKCAVVNVDALAYFNVSLKTNPLNCIELIKINPKTLLHADFILQSNELFALSSIRANPEAMLYCMFRSSESFVLDAIKINKEVINFADSRFKKSTLFLLEAFKIDPSILKHADEEEILNNFNFFFEILKIDITAFQYASEHLRKNLKFIWKFIRKDIVLCVADRLNENAEIVRFAHDSVKNNKDFLVDLAKYRINPFLYAGNQILENIEAIKEILQCRPKLYEFLSPSLRDSDDLALFLIMYDTNFLQWASLRLRDSDEIANKAIEARSNFSHSKWLRRDDENAIEQMKYKPPIAYFSARLQDDEKIALNSSYCDKVFKYISPRLQQERQFKDR